METIHKIGRRKTAVARVYLKEGKGNITINKRELANYFPTGTLQYKVKQPLVLTENETTFDIYCIVAKTPTSGTDCLAQLPNSTSTGH